MELLKKGFNFLSYTLDQCIYKGKFRSLWTATDQSTNRTVTIKFENPAISKSNLSHESEILKEISSEPYDFFPKYYGNGTENGLNYLIFSEVGHNLKTFKEFIGCSSGTLACACVLGIEMLKAIRSFHEQGFVHRNLKPTNFVFRGDEEHMELFLIGYGLSKRWRSPDGEIYPPREKVGFKGSLHYASINSHEGCNMGRRDDLWSIFYIVVELFYILPWKKMKDIDEVYHSKWRSYELKRDLCLDIPQFKEFIDYIISLKFDDEPDYDYLIKLLDSLFNENKTEAPPFSRK